ncbi:hypothetical protein NQ317_009610 [Molorchus minor]|uniref:Uncharacterized protein n=1 Tax=Molorchus minor TaxID=1323400 RepID=A0ABQ9JTA3_9CUCU|nr:hypothetical protein NQ317_009610 [Molorchus minor]
MHLSRLSFEAKQNAYTHLGTLVFLYIVELGSKTYCPKETFVLGEQHILRPVTLSFHLASGI